MSLLQLLLLRSDIVLNGSATSLALSLLLEALPCLLFLVLKSLLFVKGRPYFFDSFFE